MLILTRNPKQKIVINGNIEVVILNAGKGRIRLGIIAPKETSIQRKEVPLNAQPPKKTRV